MDMMMDWEAEVLFWIRDNLTCGFMDFLMSAVSLLLTANILWFVVALALIYKKNTRRVGTILLLALIISIILCNGIMKPCFERVRPYVEYGVPIIIPENGGYSFPSGHTTSVTVITTILLKYYRKWGYAMMVFAVMVMFSRMYLFVHYPTDILGGIAVGIVSVILAHLIIGYIERRRGDTTDGMQ